MVAGGFHPVKLHVRQMRQPGQRMPVAGGIGFEGPPDAPGRKPLLDGFVGGDISRVVVIDKLALMRALRLGNLILMMRELQIRAAAVNIEMLAQQF